MEDKAVLLFSPEMLQYNFGEGHPFNSRRLEMTYDLLGDFGVLLKGDQVLPDAATTEDLLLAHEIPYIEAVKVLSRGEKVPQAEILYDLATEDNPVFPHMHEAASWVVGASLTGARLVMEGKATHAVNLSGGLHHAQAGRASGFCLYNDAVVAISYLNRELGARVAYIDVDAHHGDGVQEAFYRQDDVLTVSIHETGRYLFPGTGDFHEQGERKGFGYTVNIPLEPFTEDRSFMQAFNAVVLPVVRSFKPDIIVSQHGCDGHHWDPLTHLALTTRSLEYVPQCLHQLAHEVCQGRWLVLGGGGYDHWRVVPRAWALLWGVVSGRRIPDSVPRTWLERWQPRAPVPLPLAVRDDPANFVPIPRRRDIEEKNMLTVNKIIRLMEPIMS